jgi:hypothetical protein
MRFTCLTEHVIHKEHVTKQLLSTMYENSMNQTNLLFHFQTNHYTINQNMHYQLDLSRMRKKHGLGKMGFSFQDPK